MTSSAPASKAAACAQAGATGTCHTASGSAASQASQAANGCSSHAASVHSGGSSVPSSARGVTTSVISGIATRLATKPTSEICWKKSSVSGARPKVATSCVRTPPRMAWIRR